MIDLEELVDLMLTKALENETKESLEEFIKQNNDDN